MKKLLAISLSLLFCFSLAGCNKSNKDNSSKADLVSTSDSSSADSALSDGISQGIEVKNSDLQEVEAKIKPLIDKYYGSMKNKNYDDFKSVFPDFYIEALTKEITDNSMTMDNFMPNNYEYFVSNYGSNFDFSYTIDKVVDLNEESIGVCEKAISDTFGKTVDITKAYGITITETITGDSVESGESGTEIEWLMYEIDGQNYLYESYYES